MKGGGERRHVYLAGKSAPERTRALHAPTFPGRIFGGKLLAGKSTTGNAQRLPVVVHSNADFLEDRRFS